MKEEKTRLIIEENAIYEIDLECMQKREEKKRKKDYENKIIKSSANKRK